MKKLRIAMWICLVAGFALAMAGGLVFGVWPPVRAEALAVAGGVLTFFASACLFTVAALLDWAITDWQIVLDRDYLHWPTHREWVDLPAGEDSQEDIQP